MANEDENKRPQPSQILEFICKHNELLRQSSGDLIHRNLKESLYFVNQKFNFFEKSTIPIEFNLNKFNLNNQSLNLFNNNNNNGFDITKDYKYISCLARSTIKEYYIIIDGKYFSLYSFKNSLHPYYFDLLFSEEMFSFYFMECSKVFPLSLEPQYIFMGINVTNYLIANPTENNLKQISIQNPNTITKKIQLILLFKLILLFFQIFEKGDSKMLNLYFDNFSGLQVFLTNKNETTKDEENQEPFNDVKFSILSTIFNLTEKPPNFIENVFKVYNIETKDPVIDKIYDYFNTTFEKAETPVYFHYKYIYQILENEKERLINENKYLMEYYDKLDTSYNNILKKTSIPEAFVIIKQVKLFHTKISKNLPIFIVYLEGEVFGAFSEKKFGLYPIIVDQINSVLEKIQFEPLLKPSKKINSDLLLYDLPTKLKESIDQYSDWEKKRSMFTDEEKNNYFMKLTNKHLNNVIQLKSIKDYQFIYGLETIIVGEEIFYIFDYLFKSPFNLVGSIYDIALYVYGQEDSCQQLLNLNFFKHLNYLFCYCVLVVKGHSKIEYSPLNGLYYLNRLLTTNNNNNDNLTNYSKITIGSIKYNILEILNLNHHKDNDLYYDYKTMILLLETTDTNEKIYCIRKQKKDVLTEEMIDEVKFEEIDNNKFKEFNNIIITPCYIVQDINTSYYFFKSELKIKSIKDIIEKDYNNISITRSLLYYLEYFVSNQSNSSQVILIKSKSVLDQETEDFLINFDVSYFIKRVYGIYIENRNWDKYIRTIYSGKSLYSNYFITNKNKILNDKTSLEIIERNNDKMKDIIGYDKIFIIEEIEKIKENVHLVKINDKFYIRKITGSIRETKEMYLTDENWDFIQPISKYKNNFLYVKKKEILSEQFSNFEIDILKHQFNSEFLILNMIKGMERVVQIYDYYLDDDLIFILIDYCEKTTNLSKYKIKDPSQITLILKQMVKILEKLKEHDIYHCDIKNENILIQENNGEIQCILADFGTSGIGSELKKDEKKYYSRNGSRNYQPLEIYIKKYRSKNPVKSLENKYDIFSLGCVIKSLFNENKLKADKDINTIIEKMTQLHYDERINLKELKELTDHL
ncbi:hypothetical protein DICPUDRAFT_79056 [Dictyostelium purpureum]|uniref:non-specific serine/threonine protein kinase n=1 Tax=Dictyostelium purpureum TaxID=5786 RepID=F0ZLF2_DICPU|nr:uncharacterized protein DICPUDRAFT_79056 [Dictyostelium purpureum]EGC35208.1 hypothetical protein DICPUDRAFT_79056 [Dictyostelium purpureum]|eukprot:XP_003288246.1 hypothetical protein DICPUDRAFT_79056 [Dictyostelium purpureum]